LELRIGEDEVMEFAPLVVVWIAEGMGRCFGLGAIAAARTEVAVAILAPSYTVAIERQSSLKQPRIL